MKLQYHQYGRHFARTAAAPLHRLRRGPAPADARAGRYRHIDFTVGAAVIIITQHYSSGLVTVQYYSHIQSANGGRAGARHGTLYFYVHVAVHTFHAATLMVY